MRARLRVPLAAALLLAATPALAQPPPDPAPIPEPGPPDEPEDFLPDPAAPPEQAPPAQPPPTEAAPPTAEPAPAPPRQPPTSAPISLAEPTPPSALSGIERPGTEPGDPARAIASALLYLPRKTIDLLFLASGTAAGLIHDEQVVPRIADIVEPDEGEIGIFPTAFVETGTLRFSVGARAIANLGSVATGLRAGYGGPDELVVESRVRFTRSGGIPATLSLEAFHDRRTDLGYGGVGQVPAEDTRNRFLPGVAARDALYRERRVRGITSLGLRPAADVEVFLSSSFTRRRIDDPEDAGDAAFSKVFEPNSVPGAGADSRFVYTEAAVRADTRASRVRPSPGVLIEMYGGASAGDAGVGGPLIYLARTGGRVAAFIPLVRQTTIISPKVVVDSVISLDGPLPFTELTQQPDYRGPGTRRDQVSMVGSLDYRWAVLRYVDARLFVDAATVGPDPGALDFKHVRIAGGVGADLASASAEIGRAALVVSPDGARVLFSIGGSTRFGDRQHRD